MFIHILFTVIMAVLIAGLHMLKAWYWVLGFFKNEKPQSLEYFPLGEGVANSNTRACELDPRNKLCHDGKPDCCLKDRVTNGE